MPNTRKAKFLHSCRHFEWDRRRLGLNYSQSTRTVMAAGITRWGKREEPHSLFSRALRATTSSVPRDKWTRARGREMSNSSTWNSYKYSLLFNFQAQATPTEKLIRDSLNRNQMPANIPHSFASLTCDQANFSRIRSAINRPDHRLSRPSTVQL